MAVLEHNVDWLGLPIPRIAANKVHLIDVDGLAVLLVGIVAVAHIDCVVGNVFLHHIPRAAAQAETFALADGVKPVALVLANLLACFKFDDVALLLAKMTTNKVVVVYLAKEADALAVLAVGIRQLCLLGDAAHFLFGERSDWEHQVRQLLVGDLSKEVGLILYRVDRRGEIVLAVDKVGSGIMPSGSHIEVLSPALLKVAELYHLIAHHIRVWSESALDCAQSILHNIVPVFLVQRNNFERQTIAVSNGCAHLNIFFCRAVALVCIHSDTDIKQRQVVAFFLEFVHHDSAVDTTRNQCSNFHLFCSPKSF